jgi:hypothetical protein
MLSLEDSNERGRRQKFFHVCGNAKLSRFLHCFRSLQSGWQLFGLGQSLGCPCIPIVTASPRGRQLFHVGRTSSASAEPQASDFIGSVGTCASRISRHFMHRRVQCSNPERAAAMDRISMRDWHLRQRGRAAARDDRVGVCGSGIALPCIRRERYQISLSPIVADGGAVMRYSAPIAAGDSGQYCSLSES